MTQMYPSGPQPDPVQRARDEHMLMQGVIGGVLAGVVFAIASSLIFAVFGKNFWDSMRLLGSIVLGQRAMDPGYSLATAAGIGGALWLVLTAFYGTAFIYIVSWIRQLSAGFWRLVIYGFIYGMVLWVINLMVIPAVAFPWFFDYINQFWNGFIAHSVFFGAVLGGYIALVWPWAREQLVHWRERALP